MESVKKERLLHDRTDAELDEQLSGLSIIYKIFSSLDIQIFLSGGTVLGAVRQNDFIPWDWNVSVMFRAEDLGIKLNIILAELELNGFSNQTSLKGLNHEYIGIKSKKNGITYYMENTILIDLWRTRPYHKIPAKFLESFEMVKLRGKNFPCPYPSREYCRWHYGENWETPIKVTHRKEVINPELHRKKNERKNK